MDFFYCSACQHLCIILTISKPHHTYMRMMLLTVRYRNKCLPPPKKKKENKKHRYSITTNKTPNNRVRKHARPQSE